MNGVHYRFMGRAEFEAMRESGRLLEAAEVHGNLYGTPDAEVTEWLERGWIVILDIDKQGYRAIKKRLQATGIFVMPPSMADLDARLRARGSENDANLKDRLESAEAELAAAKEYEHVVVNDDVDRTLKEVEEILRLPAGGMSNRGKHS